MSFPANILPGASGAEAGAEALADRLLTWFATFGGRLHPAIVVAPQTDGRGLRLALKETTETTSQSGEQLLVSCPHVLAFSVLQVPFVASWWPADWLNSLDLTVLTRFLLVEAYLQGTESVFFPYISMLPQPDTERPFNTTLYWSEAERTAIRGTNLQTATAHRGTEWRKELDAAKQYLLQLRPDARQRVSRYSIDLYRWAATVLSSRCFPNWMIDAGQDREPPAITEKNAHLVASTFFQRWMARDPTLRFPVLLPIFDLANHSPDAKVTWQPTEDSADLLSSTESRAAGSEVFNNYGQKANEELLLGYGFDLTPNPANSFLLSLAIAVEEDKLRFVRGIVEDALYCSSSTSIIFPQILNPGTSFEDQPRVFGLRSEHPLTSAAATPLALMNMNSRELRAFVAAPLRFPNTTASHLPTRNGIAVLCGFGKHLKDGLDKIRQADPGVPSQRAIDSNHNMQMGMRHRLTQINILEHGLSSLTSTFNAWLKTDRILEIDELLTAVTPRPILKKFRQIIHRTLGTRDPKRIRRGSEHEVVFAFWIVNLINELDRDNDDSIDDTDPDHMTIHSLRAWLAKMEAGYGPVVPTQAQPGQDEEHDSEAEEDVDENDDKEPEEDGGHDIDELCWDEGEREAAKKDFKPYVKLLVQSGLLESMQGMEKKLQWAIRVVREETVWVQGWLYPRPMREGISSSDEERDPELPEEDEDAMRLVWVLQEPEETHE